MFQQRVDVKDIAIKKFVENNSSPYGKSQLDIWINGRWALLKDPLLKEVLPSVFGCAKVKILEDRLMHFLRSHVAMLCF